MSISNSNASRRSVSNSPQMATGAAQAKSKRMGNGHGAGTTMSPREQQRREVAINHFYNTLALSTISGGGGQGKKNERATVAKQGEDHGEAEGVVGDSSSGGTPQGLHQKRANNSTARTSSNNMLLLNRSLEGSEKSGGGLFSPSSHAGGGGGNAVRPLSIKDRFMMHADVANQAAHQQLVSNSSLLRQPTISSMVRASTGVHLAAVTPLRAPPLPQPAVETTPTGATSSPSKKTKGLTSTSTSPAPLYSALNGGEGKERAMSQAHSSAALSTSPAAVTPARTSQQPPTTTVTSTQPHDHAYRRPRPDDELLSMTVPNINTLAPGVYSSSVKKPPSRGLGGGAFPPSLPVRMDRNPITGKLRPVTRDSDTESDDDDNTEDHDYYNGEYHNEAGEGDDESDMSFSAVENNSITFNTTTTAATTTNTTLKRQSQSTTSGQPQQQGLVRSVSFNVHSLSTTGGNGGGAYSHGGGGGGRGEKNTQIGTLDTSNASDTTIINIDISSNGNTSSTTGIPIVLQKIFRLQTVAYTNPVARLFRDKVRAPPLELIETAVRGNRQNLLQPHQFYQWCLRVLWLDNPNFYKGREGAGALRKAAAEALAAVSGGSGSNVRSNAKGGSSSPLTKGQRRVGGETSPLPPRRGGGGVHSHQEQVKERVRQGADAPPLLPSLQQQPTTGSYFDNRRRMVDSNNQAPANTKGGSNKGSRVQNAQKRTPQKFNVDNAHEYDGDGGLNRTPLRHKTDATTVSLKGLNSPRHTPQPRGGDEQGPGRDDASEHTDAGSNSPVVGPLSEVDAVKRLATPSTYTRARARAMHKAQQTAAFGEAGKLFSSPNENNNGLMTTNMLLKREKKRQQAEAETAITVGRGESKALRASSLLSSSGGGRPSLLPKLRTNSQRHSSTTIGVGNNNNRDDDEDNNNNDGEDDDDDETDSVASACSDDFDTTPSSVKYALSVYSHHAAAVRGSNHAGAGAATGAGSKGTNTNAARNTSITTSFSSSAGIVASMARYDSDLKAVIESATDPNERVQLLNSLANFRRTHFLARQHNGGDGHGGDSEYHHNQTSILTSRSVGSHPPSFVEGGGGAGVRGENYSNASAQADANLDVFADAMRNFSAGVPFSRAEVQQVFQLLDANDDGVLEHRELCDGMVHLMGVDGPLMPLLHRFRTLVAPKFRRDVRLVRISRQELVLFQEAVVAVLLRQLRSKIRRRERFVNYYRLSGVLFPADTANAGGLAEHSHGGEQRFMSMAGVVPNYNNEAAHKKAAAEAKRGHTVVTKSDGSVLIVKDLPHTKGSLSSPKKGGAEEEGASAQTTSRRHQGTKSTRSLNNKPRTLQWHQGGEDEYSDGHSPSHSPHKLHIKNDGNNSDMNSHNNNRRHLPLPPRTEPLDALKAKKQLLVKYQAAKASGGARLDTRQKLSDFILPENENYFHRLSSTQWFILMEEKYGAGSANPFNPAYYLGKKGSGGSGGGGPTSGDFTKRDIEELQREAEAMVDARRRREMVELGKIAALRKEIARNAMQSRLERATEVCPPSSLLTYLLAVKRRDEERVARGEKSHPSSRLDERYAATAKSGGNGGYGGTNIRNNNNSPHLADDYDDEEDDEEAAEGLPLTSLRTLMSPAEVDAMLAAQRLRATSKAMPRYLLSTKSSAIGNGNGMLGDSDPSSLPSLVQQSHEFLLENTDKLRPVPDTPQVRAVLNYLDLELTLPIKLLEQTIRRFYIDYDQHILSTIGAQPVSYKVVQDILIGEGEDEEGPGRREDASSPKSGAASPFSSSDKVNNDTMAQRLKSNKIAAQLASAVPTSAKGTSKKKGAGRGEGGGEEQDDSTGFDLDSGASSPRRCDTAGMHSVSSVMAFSMVSLSSSAPPTADKAIRGTSMEAAKTLEAKQKSTTQTLKNKHDNTASIFNEDGEDHQQEEGTTRHRHNRKEEGGRPAAPYIRTVAQKYFVDKLPFERDLRESYLSYYYRELDADEGETVFKPMRQLLQHPTLERVGVGGSTSPHSPSLGSPSSHGNRKASSSSASSVPFAASLSPSAMANRGNPLVLHHGGGSGEYEEEREEGDANNNGGEPQNQQQRQTARKKVTVGGLALSSINANASHATDANRRTLFNPDSPRGVAVPSSEVIDAGRGNGALPATAGLGTMGSGVDVYGNSNSFASVGMLSGAGGKIAASSFFARRKTTAPVLGRPAEEYTDVEHVLVDGRVVVRPKRFFASSSSSAANPSSSSPPTSAPSPLLRSSPENTGNGGAVGIAGKPLIGSAALPFGGFAGNNKGRGAPRSQTSLGFYASPNENKARQQASTPDPFLR